MHLRPTRALGTKKEWRSLVHGTGEGDFLMLRWIYSLWAGFIHFLIVGGFYSVTAHIYTAPNSFKGGHALNSFRGNNERTS